MGILASGNLYGVVAHVPLPGFLNSLASPLDHYGYWAVALLLLLENIGVPVVPGEFAMIVGAIFAATGRAGLNIVVVGIVSLVASFAGAEIGYLIGRFAGRELILRYGRYVFLKGHHLDRAQSTVDRYGGVVVIIARFIVGLREANGIIAGITQMRWLTFTIYNAIGACAWVGTWVSIGYIAGDHIDTIYSVFNRVAIYLLVAVAVLVIGYVAWRLVRRGRSREPQQAPASEATPEARDDLEAEENLVAGESLEHRENLEADERAEPEASLEADERAEPEASMEDGERAEPEASMEDGEGLEAEAVLEATEGPEASRGPGNAQSS
jgi:membrane protein DedA with SNARE-associated domain